MISTHRETKHFPLLIFGGFTLFIELGFVDLLEPPARCERFRHTWMLVAPAPRNYARRNCLLLLSCLAFDISGRLGFRNLKFQALYHSIVRKLAGILNLRLRNREFPGGNVLRVGTHSETRLSHLFLGWTSISRGFVTLPCEVWCNDTAQGQSLCGPSEGLENIALDYRLLSSLLLRDAIFAFVPPVFHIQGFQPSVGLI